MKRISLTRLMLSVILVFFLAVNETLAQEEEGEELKELSPFVVSTEQDVGYIAINSLSGTRTEVNLLEIPISIVAITQEILLDTGVDSLEDAVDYASSIVPSGEKVRDSEFDVRGFDAVVFRDGFISRGFTDVATIDRIEIAKGAQGVIYGISSPGGVINVINKKPMFLPFRGSLTMQVGTEEYLRSVLDFTGVVGSEKRISYRFIGAYQKNDGQALFQEFEKKVWSPSITWNITDKLTVYARYEHTEVNEGPTGPGAYPLTFRPSESTPVGQDSRVLVLSVGPEYNFNGPGSYKDNTSATLLTELTYKLNDNFTYKFAYTTFDRDTETLLRAGFLRPLAGLPVLNRRQTDKFNSWSYRNDFLFDFKISGIQNRLLLTQEATRGDTSRIDRQNNNGSGISTSLPGNFFPVPQALIDREPLFRDGFRDPVVGDPVSPDDYQFSGALENDFSEFNRVQNLGSGFGTNSFGAVNQMSMLDGRLKLIAGLRWDEDIGDTSTADPLAIDDITYQIGSLFKATDEMNIFFNYSTNFIPQPGALGVNDEALGPQTGGGFDIGLKVNLFESKVVGSLAYFDLSREDIARIVVIADDPDTPEDEEDRFSALSGKESVKGIEFDLVISPLPNTQVLLSYAYMDSEILAGAPPLGGTFTGLDVEDVGNPIVGAPQQSASFLIRNAFREGPLTGLTLGGGGVYYDDYRLEARVDRIHWRTENFLTFNFFANYAFTIREKKMSIQLNIDNLLDEVAFERRGQWVAPRRVKLVYVVHF